ncbi:MAG: polysaccharide biosynthesis tyrosine autokinase [Endomicrobiaceae bacterium]|jgi:capsular exopolysaccharide synthesis family protein|nr:polysaccharide biosynthesis tyrosine autokinase [Endomicrobiaceae bacterium]MDD3729459.1 polysaccharide biosynthesis tyrosine autokinase [Endomicrobiaceae bacterium]MDD4165594.1 polysaccharide biosynthesis tyrosine autokinase [Endomicrobiaceae bacterium]
MTDNANNNNNLDFSYYLTVILKHFWLIATIAIIGIFGAVVANILIQPVYKASVLMMIDREESGKIETNSLGSWTTDEDYYRTQYKLLESRTLLEKVHKKLNLDNYEEFKNPNGWLKLKNKIKISPIVRSRLVNLEISSYEKKLTAQIANILATTFVSDNISNRVIMAQDVIKALESTEKSQQQLELLNSLPQVVNSDFIKNLKSREISLQGDYANLTAKYTDNHPSVISVRNQINAIKMKIDTETKRIIQSLKIELSGQFSGNNIRIIDEAITPDRPYIPRKLINLAIGFFAGLLTAFIIVFFMEFIDKSIKNSEDLERELHLPFLGFVPFEKLKNSSKKEYESMLKDGNHILAEQIRNIRTMLNFTLSDDPKTPILVVSSLQGEGKTHLASNLAIAIAQIGKKVLLIDGDFRRSRLHKMFKLTTEKGLSNIWNKDSDKSDFSSNIQSTEVENLFVMTSGLRPPNPSELLNTPMLSEFIKWASQNYDNVIVDCPAVVPVSDTLLWGNVINKAVFVVKHNKTNAKLSKLAIDKLQKANIKILGAVISHFKQEGLTYGKYGYYKNYHYYK